MTDPHETLRLAEVAAKTPFRFEPPGFVDAKTKYCDHAAKVAVEYARRIIDLEVQLARVRAWADELQASVYFSDKAMAGTLFEILNTPAQPEEPHE